MKPKNLANGFAIAAALAIASPAWAQSTPPAAGAGMQGADPMTIPAPAAPANPNNLPAAGAGMQGADPMTIPAHHAVRHAHAMHAHHKAMAGKAALTGDTTAQLNREELARIQAGTPPAPPPAPPPQPLPQH